MIHAKRGRTTNADATDPGAPEGSRSSQKGATAPKRDERETFGRSHGGFGTKICVIVDSAGRAVVSRLRQGRRTSCLMPSRSSLPSPVCRSGLWHTAATPATPSANTSGTSAHALPSRRRGTTPQSPAQTGSATTATASGASGPGSRSGAPSPPVTRKLPRPSLGSNISQPGSIGSSPRGSYPGTAPTEMLMKNKKTIAQTTQRLMAQPSPRPSAARTSASSEGMPRRPGIQKSS